MTNRHQRFNRAQFPLHSAPVIAPMLALGRQHPRRERTMWRARLAVAALAIIATSAALESARAEDDLKIAVGGRGIGETFVTEVGYKAGLFHRHNLALDIFYTDGGGETQQAVISNSAQIGIASGLLGAIGVFAKGAPVRVIGGAYTGGAQLFWYVPANSPIRAPQDLAGKTVAYSNNGSSNPCRRARAAEALSDRFQANADRQCRRAHARDHERPGRCRLGRRAIRSRRA